MSSNLFRSWISVTAIVGTLSLGAFSEEPRQAVSAPYADKLVKEEMAAHPEIKFLGLHATPPGKTDNLIIAASNPVKIGLVSTAEDMVYAQPNQAKVFHKPGASDYEVDLWFGDAASRTLGMIVVRLDAAAVKNESEAQQRAIEIRDELQKKIADRDQLFASE